MNLLQMNKEYRTVDDTIRDRGRAQRLALFALLFAQFASAVYWLGNYPLWFGAEMLSSGLDYANAFGADGVAGFVSQGAHSIFYPPGYDVACGFFHFFFGFNRFNILIVNFFFLGIAAFSINGIGRLIGGRFVGFIASLIFLFSQKVYFLSRIPSRELCLTGALCLAVWALHYSSRFKNTWVALLFALSFTVGMYIKWTFVGYMLIPLIYFFISIIRYGMEQEQHKTRIGLTGIQWFNIIFCAALIFAALAPWYIGVLDWKMTGMQLGNEPSAMTGLMSFYDLNNKIFGKWLLLFAFVPLAFFGKGRARPWMALLWFSSGYALFMLIPHKEVRYFIPILPAFALISAMGIAGLPAKGLKALAGVAVISFGMMAFITQTFMRPVIPNQTGEVSTMPSMQCGNSTERMIFDLEKVLSKKFGMKNSAKAVEIALHPFGQYGNFFGMDELALWAQLRRNKRHSPDCSIIGFDIGEYDRFISEIEHADILLVDEKIYSMPKNQMNSFISDWESYNRPDEKKGGPPKDDPAMLTFIEGRFRPADKIDDPCADPIRILTRR